MSYRGFNYIPIQFWSVPPTKCNIPGYDSLGKLIEMLWDKGDEVYEAADQVFHVRLAKNRQTWIVSTPEWSLQTFTLTRQVGHARDHTMGVGAFSGDEERLKSDLILLKLALD